MPREPDPLTLAKKALGASSVATDADPPDPINVFYLVLEAQVHATIAVAEQLAALRNIVSSGLHDRDGFSAGQHLYYISDWLKDIAERPIR